MPLPVIANTVRFAVEGRLEQGTNWANIIHISKPAGAPTSTDIANMAAEIDKLYTGPSYGGGAQFWSGAVVNGASITQIVATPLDGVSASTIFAVNTSGANVEDPLPAATAIVFTLRTALRGPSHRGRVYWGGFGEGFCDATGNPIPATLTLLLSQWLQFETALNALGFNLVVASYLNSVATVVTTITAQARWRTQRRRNPQ